MFISNGWNACRWIAVSVTLIAAACVTANARKKRTANKFPPSRPCNCLYVVTIALALMLKAIADKHFSFLSSLFCFYFSHSVTIPSTNDFDLRQIRLTISTTSFHLHYRWPLGPRHLPFLPFFSFFFSFSFSYDLDNFLIKTILGFRSTVFHLFLTC